MADADRSVAVDDPRRLPVRRHPVPRCVGAVGTRRTHLVGRPATDNPARGVRPAGPVRNEVSIMRTDEAYGIVEAQRWGEEWPDQWYDTQDAAISGQWEPILDLRARLASIATAAAAARRELDKMIANALGDGGAIHDGQTFMRATIDGALKVRDGDALMKWLAEDAALCFNPNSVRIGSVRMVAEGRGGSADAAIDSFFHRPGEESGEPTLLVKPLDKAPKYAATMQPFQQKGS